MYVCECKYMTFLSFLEIGRTCILCSVHGLSLIQPSYILNMKLLPVRLRSWQLKTTVYSCMYTYMYIHAGFHTGLFVGEGKNFLCINVMY